MNRIEQPFRIRTMLENIDIDLRPDAVQELQLISIPTLLEQLLFVRRRGPIQNLGRIQVGIQCMEFADLQSCSTPQKVLTLSSMPFSSASSTSFDLSQHKFMRSDIERRLID